MRHPRWADQSPRAEIIARAKYWHDRGYTWYTQEQDEAISDVAYRPDCSGFVAAAWHLPKFQRWDLNTDNFHSSRIRPGFPACTTCYAATPCSTTATWKYGQKTNTTSIPGRR